MATKSPGVRSGIKRKGRPEQSGLFMAKKEKAAQRYMRPRGLQPWTGEKGPSVPPAIATRKLPPTEMVLQLDLGPIRHD